MQLGYCLVSGRCWSERGPTFQTYKHRHNQAQPLIINQHFGVDIMKTCNVRLAWSATNSVELLQVARMLI